MGKSNGYAVPRAVQDGIHPDDAVAGYSNTARQKYRKYISPRVSGKMKPVPSAYTVTPVPEILNFQYSRNSFTKCTLYPI